MRRPLFLHTYTHIVCCLNPLFDSFPSITVFQLKGSGCTGTGDEEERPERKISDPLFVCVYVPTRYSEMMMRMTVTWKGRSRRSTQIRMNAHEFEWRAFAFITDHQPVRQALPLLLLPSLHSLCMPVLFSWCQRNETGRAFVRVDVIRRLTAVYVAVNGFSWQKSHPHSEPAIP